MTHRKILFLFLLSALHFYWKTWLITYSAAVRCSFPNIELLSQNISIGGIQIQAICLVIPVITIISLVVLLHIVNHTKTGMAMRAVSKDYEIARVMGVDIDKIISITFIIGSSLAAIGAIMWGIRYPGITPMMGVMPGLKALLRRLSAVSAISRVQCWAALYSAWERS